LENSESWLLEKNQSHPKLICLAALTTLTVHTFSWLKKNQSATAPAPHAYLEKIKIIQTSSS
jgi:hypothetical protein